MRLSISLAAFLAGLLFANTTLVAQDEDDRDPGKILRVVVTGVIPPNYIGASVFLKYGPTREDYRRIKALAGDHRITPVREVPREARVGERETDAVLIGTSPDYAAEDTEFIERGRFLTGKDLKLLNNVAVLGAETARELFPLENPLGKNVRVGKNYYLIVGVAKPGLGREREPGPKEKQKPPIFIPISTMRSRMGDRVINTESGSSQFEEYEISRIEVDVPVAEADRLSVTIGRLLRESHEMKDYQIQIQLSQPVRRTP